MFTFELLNELIKFDAETPLFRGVWGKLSRIQVLMENGMMILEEDTQGTVKTVGELRQLIGKFDDMPVFLTEGGGSLEEINQVVSESSMCIITD